MNTGHITVGPPHLIATKLLDVLTNQQQIMQEVTATAERMLEAIEALLPAAQQVRWPLGDSGALALLLAQMVNDPPGDAPSAMLLFLNRL